MITEFMKLSSKNDARFWANSMLEGTDYGDLEIERLKNFLWEKFHGLTYGEVRELMPTNENFWNIVRGTK